MNYSLPFFEKKGTISNIREADKYYLVERYGLTSKEKNNFRVPKNEKNYYDLMDNYYNDVKDYLSKYANRYESYKMSRLKKPINTNVISILSSASIIMLVTSVPMLLTHGTLGYLGVILDVLSVPLIITSTNLKLKNNNNEKKINFIDKYNKLERQLMLYNEDKTRKNDKTKYKGLVKDKEKEPVRDLVKVLEKKKVA